MTRKHTNNLLKAIDEKNWNNVYHCLDQTSLPDSTNVYALHRICSYFTAPIKIITDIYNAYPIATFFPIKNGQTPISIAVDAGFEDAVQFLAKVCPEACLITNYHGSTPIFLAVYAITYSSIIDILLDACPRAAFIKRGDGDYAFNAFFEVWNIFLRISLHDEITIHQIHEYVVGAGNWAIFDIYQKGCLFLKSANLHYKGQALDDDHLLHFALREESCHFAFCKLLMIMHPDQVMKRDADGNLPIHVITASKEKSDVESFLCFDCYLIKSKLVNIEYKNGDTEYCCEDCFKSKSGDLMSKAYYISPGK